MSKKAYIKKPYLVHTFTCTFEVDGETKTGKHTYYGEFFQALLTCQTEHLWSKHPTFRIENVKSREV